MDLQKTVGHNFTATEQSYEARDTILYALGTGFGQRPLDPKHLQYLFEDRLQASPSFANVLGHPGMWARDPQFKVDWKRLLHAEQRLEMHKALPPAGVIIAEHAIMGVRDHGERGAIVHQRKEVIEKASGDAIATVTTSLMLRGDGGCGDWGDIPEELERVPEREPDATLDLLVPEIQPLIYRLSGDLNPLHIDPDIAHIAGFERPILHGLSTKGMAAYAILRLFCDFNAAKLRSMAVRFTRPVLPGDTVRFEFWRQDGGRLRFRATVPERDNLIVLDRCYALCN